MERTGARRSGVGHRAEHLRSPRIAGAAILAILLLAAGCASQKSRRLDPVYANETCTAELKFRYKPGTTDPGILMKFEPGDIVAFSSGDDSSAFGAALSSAMSQVSHVAIVIPLNKKLRVLSADSDRGVDIDTIEGCVKDRAFFVFAFPSGLLAFDRLTDFAERAVFLGRLDYDWSAIFGMPSNLMPNTLQEVGDEYTCSTVVAAALHFSGLSLDRGWKGIVSPGDIIHSTARRNLNGPAVMGSAQDRQKRANREAEAWEALR